MPVARIIHVMGHWISLFKTNDSAANVSYLYSDVQNFTSFQKIYIVITFRQFKNWPFFWFARLAKRDTALLDVSSHHYKRVCSSVGRSIGRSVGRAHVFLGLDYRNCE